MSIFIVRVTDHGHYMEDEGERMISCTTLEEAREQCEEIIDRSLDELFSSGMKEEELLKQFMMFGEEASTDGFDGNEYAKKRCQEMCA